MKRIALTNRVGPLWHVDLSSRIRMGDLAGIYCWLSEWRVTHPEARLLVYWNPLDSVSHYSKFLPIDWVLRDVVDELWIRTAATEPVPPLPGEAVLHFYNHKHERFLHLWQGWHQLHPKRLFDPKIYPPKHMLDLVQRITKAYSLPEKYVVLQPLFEAGYHKYRNAPPAWWIEVAKELLALQVPTAILGPSQYRHQCPMPKGVYPLWDRISDPFESLAVICKAAAHVGGETGLPLWATLFRVPVVATWREWAKAIEQDGTVLDYRPISFGAPVVFAQLEGNPGAVARIIKGVYDGKITQSTPIEPDYAIKF